MYSPEKRNGVVQTCSTCVPDDALLLLLLLDWHCNIMPDSYGEKTLVLQIGTVILVGKEEICKLKSYVDIIVFFFFFFFFFFLHYSQ